MSECGFELGATSEEYCDDECQGAEAAFEANCGDEYTAIIDCKASLDWAGAECTNDVIESKQAACDEKEAAFGDCTRDSDGDGLTDKEEAELGTNPNLTDTDGDGYSDMVEVDSHTDPTDQSDHPYAGGWPIDACRNDLVGSGVEEGDVIDNLTVTDQFGEELKLHDFCNHVVLIAHAGFSDGGSTAEAPVLEELYQEYRAEGFIIVTVMFGGEAVDLAAWAYTYGLSHPVASDTSNLASLFGVHFLPTHQVIGRGGVIKQKNQGQISTADIEAALAEGVF